MRSAGAVLQCVLQCVVIQCAIHMTHKVADEIRSDGPIRIVCDGSIVIPIVIVIVIVIGVNQPPPILTGAGALTRGERRGDARARARAGALTVRTPGSGEERTQGSVLHGSLFDLRALHVQRKRRCAVIELYLDGERHPVVGHIGVSIELKTPATRIHKMRGKAEEGFDVLEGKSMRIRAIWQ